MRGVIQSIRLSNVIAVLLFAGISGKAQSVPNGLDNYEAIIVADIEKADPAEGCGGVFYLQCPLDVDVSVAQILKDNTHQGLRPGEFHTIIPRRPHGGGDVPVGWQRMMFREIRAGQRYLLFSDREFPGRGAGLVAIFQSPRLVMPVTKEDDPVADVQLILASAALPLRQQADRAASALSGGGQPRSVLLANYVVALLTEGTETDTAALVQTLEYTPASVFSDFGKGGLLGQLWYLARSRSASQSRLHLFVVLTTKYLVSAPDEWHSPEPGISVRGMMGYMHWILGSERALAVFRRELNPVVIDEFRARALKIVVDGRFPSQQRADLRAALDMLSAR